MLRGGRLTRIRGLPLLSSAGLSGIATLLGSRRKAVIGLIVCSMLSGFIEAGLLAILAQSAAALVDGASKVTVDLGPDQASLSLGLLLGTALALGIARLVLQVPIAVLPARIAADTQAKLRNGLFSAFTRASWDVQSRDREGHLQELVTNQMTYAIQGALQATILVVAVASFVVLVISALALNFIAALLVLVTASALLVLMRPLSNLGRRRAQALSRASMDYAGGINEAVRLAEETRVFGIGSAQRQRIENLVGHVQDGIYGTAIVGRLVTGVYQSLIYLLLAGALAALYLTHAGQVPALGAVVLLLVRAGTYGQQAQGAAQVVRQSLPYLERLNEAQERYSENATIAGEHRLPAVRRLAFDHVSFAYDSDWPGLTGVTFVVAERESIGIVGPSGAGKSTLVQILIGTRTPDSGNYCVNGVEASKYNPDDWHRRIAYVPQQPRLLHASVTENIRFFRSVDDRAVQRAAVLAGIHDEIMAWSEGYNTIVGPRADAISGGQQQRICIARALAANPDVLVLDEPTSALDPHSEALIQESLTSLKHQLTLFVVAHRLSTLAMCERVMVIVGGELQAFDGAAELELSSTYYRSAVGLHRSAAAAHPLLQDGGTT